MDIAAVSMGLHAAQTAQALQISVTKKVMETQEAQAAALLEQMTPPVSQHIIDVRA